MNLKYVLRTMLSTLCNATVQLEDYSRSDTSGSKLKGDHP